MDIPLSTPPTPELLLAALEGRPIDAITVKTRARRKALLVADMDSTIVTGETLDELAGFAGIGEKIAAITARAMNGELDFKEALRERVSDAEGPEPGRPGEDLARIQLTPGAHGARRDHAGEGCADGADLRRVQFLHRQGGGAAWLRCAPFEYAAG